MKKFRKALAGAITASAAALATYLTTNTADPALVEAAIYAIISAAIAGGAVYQASNEQDASEAPPDA